MVLQYMAYRLSQRVVDIFNANNHSLICFFSSLIPILTTWFTVIVDSLIIAGFVIVIATIVIISVTTRPLKVTTNSTYPGGTTERSTNDERSDA